MMKHYFCRPLWDLEKRVFTTGYFKGSVDASGYLLGSSWTLSLDEATIFPDDFSLLNKVQKQLSSVTMCRLVSLGCDNNES